MRMIDLQCICNLFHSNDSDMCLFGSPVSETFGWSNSFLRRTGYGETRYWSDIITRYNENSLRDEAQEIFRIVNTTTYTKNPASRARPYEYGNATDNHFAVRTCNAYWNPQVTISETNVDPFYLGMASQATEREDTIITPDLRGSVSEASPPINVASIT